MDFHNAPGTLMKGEEEREKEIHSGSSPIGIKHTYNVNFSIFLI